MTIALRKPFTIALIGVFASLILLFSFGITTANAYPPPCRPGDILDAAGTACVTQTDIGLKNTQSGTQVISNIINIVLGFLGLIALILFIVGGFQWMTSGGNEEKTGAAKKLMVSAVIGLAIVLGAAVISNFAFRAIARSLGEKGTAANAL